MKFFDYAALTLASVSASGTCTAILSFYDQADAGCAGTPEDVEDPITFDIGVCTEEDDGVYRMVPFCDETGMVLNYYSDSECTTPMTT